MKEDQNRILKNLNSWYVVRQETQWKKMLKIIWGIFSSVDILNIYMNVCVTT